MPKATIKAKSPARAPGVKISAGESGSWELGQSLETYFTAVFAGSQARRS